MGAVFLLALLAAPAAAQDDNEPARRIVSFAPDSTAEQRRLAVTAAGGTVVRDLPAIGAVVAAFGGFAPKTGESLREGGAQAVEPDEYRIWIIAGPGPAIPSPAAALLGAREAAAELPGVPAAPRAAPEPEGERSEVPWGIERVGAPAVWEQGTGAGVRVAVIDTGIDASHPDIAPNYAGGYNSIDPEASPADEHGHGTHVAGTIAGARNGVGVIGVAPDARLYAVKALDGKGGGRISQIVEGLLWCVENKMQVVNMSLGGPHSEALYRAVRKAAAAGVTLVAASGNDPEAEVSAPARYAEAIAVSASTSDNGLAEFSTTGEAVDFIAPGHEILSAWPGRKLAKLSGTSMASPHVAGLAALAVGFGAAGPSGVRAALAGAAKPLPGLEPAQQGAGLVDASRWLK